MLAAQRGDSQAYKELLNALIPVIRTFLNRRLLNKNNVEDLIQETLIAIHTARHTYRPELPFDRWLYSIARYKMTDALRRAYRDDQRRSVVEMDDFTPISDNGRGDNATEDTDKALARLTAKQRKIVTLAKIEGYTSAEVARELEMTETAVKVTIHRALQLMRAWLVKNGY